jgi:DNA-binding NarL/FixJ family response regulator
MARAERIVVAAASGLLRAANVRLLRDAGFEVAGEAGDVPGLLRKVRAHRPDVAVIDARGHAERPGELPDAIRALRAEHGVATLVLAEAVDEPLAGALLDAGAEGAGYLLVDGVDAARYTEAVRILAAGGSALEAEVVTRMLGRDRRDHALDALSDRDREVLAQIAAGVTNRAIARRMFLSERAVERHVTRIFTALGIGRCRLDHRRVLAVLAYRRAAA